jgi:hypothetical protein
MGRLNECQASILFHWGAQKIGELRNLLFALTSLKKGLLARGLAFVFLRRLSFVGELK